MKTRTATETETQPQSLAAAPFGIERIALTGFMGAGKSTVGRLLASRLGWTFLDLDNHLEQRAGLTVPEIFSQHGEARFRRLESTALASALSHRSTVIALGGGVPESITNRLLLEQTPGTFTIFLDAPFPVLFDRCVLQDIARPVLADPDAALARFNTRHPLYTRLASLTVETANLSPEETVEILLGKFSQLQRPLPYHS
jgi:shikimate kinase